MLKSPCFASTHIREFPWRWPWALLLLFALGCGEQAQIQDYEVVKKPSESVRMVAAMIPQGQQTWFFKVTGPDEAVTKQIENVLKLITSVNYPSPTAPKWTLPEGWTQELGNGGMRFATITIPAGDDDLEMSVMALPTLNNDYEQYTLENFNRWRGQVSLPPISKDQLSDHVVKVSTVDSEAFVVNLIGTESKQGTMRAPFAGGRGAPVVDGQRPTRPVQRPPSQQPSRRPTPPTIPAHDVPKEWAKVPNRSIELETYQVKAGGKEASVTTIRMGPLTEVALLPNINRWRGQVDLGPIIQAQVRKAYSDTKAGDVAGRYFQLKGANKAMLVAALNHGGATWYFKMLGDAGLVMEKEAEFKKYVQSVRFSPDEESGDE